MDNVSAEQLSVGEFIATYGNPYDPATDDYDVPAFEKSFDNASKSSKIYNMHGYWVKQDPLVVKEFIAHYTKPGDVILDAFCGSGMTGVAAMMSGRNAVLSDISPVSIHIARNYTSQIDHYLLRPVYQDVIFKAEPEIRPLYRTKCHNCGNGDAQIANIILSDVYRCPRCGAHVLFAGEGRWEIMKKREKVDKVCCHVCNYGFTKGKAQFVRVEPMEIGVACSGCKAKDTKIGKPLDEEDWWRYIQIEGGPTQVVHHGNDEWLGYDFVPVQEFVNETGTKVLKQMLSETDQICIHPHDVPYWYPREVTFFGDEPRRNLKRGITHPYQMFSRRNLIALSVLWHHMSEIDEDRARGHMMLLFTSMLFLVSLQYRWRMGGGGGGRGNLYVPSLIRDMNVINTLPHKYQDLVESMRQLNTYRDSTTRVSIADARNLASIPDTSIDYAFYDPPYGSNINYSELNIMWEAWLGQFTDTNHEIIENTYQGKSREIYEAMMTSALKEAYRVLKPGRWLSLVYSYTDPSMFRSVQRMAAEAGFIEEGEVLHIGSASKTKAQFDSDKTQQRYLVINFKKPKQVGEQQVLDKAEIEYQVICVAQDYLSKHGGQTRDRIYDEVIKRLFTTVQIEEFNLDDILANFFRKVGDRWYAPGTLLARQPRTTKAGQARLALDEGDAEEEMILRLQDFLARHGTVPLAEFREYYLREIPIAWQEVVGFDKAIEGFTVRDGKVRLPTPEEQRRKQDVAIRYRKAKIRRYISGALDSVPSGAELCEWIGFCYENEMWDEATKLLSRIDGSSIDAELWKRTRRVAEACRLKTE